MLRVCRSLHVERNRFDKETGELYHVSKVAIRRRVIEMDSHVCGVSLWEEFLKEIEDENTHYL